MTTIKVYREKHTDPDAQTYREHPRGTFAIDSRKMTEFPFHSRTRGYEFRLSSISSRRVPPIRQTIRFVGALRRRNLAPFHLTRFGGRIIRFTEGRGVLVGKGHLAGERSE
jgi:hypothetical protein